MFAGWTDIFLPSVFLFFSSPFIASFLLLLLHSSPLSWEEPPPSSHASRLGGGGSDYRWRLSGEVAVEGAGRRRYGRRSDFTFPALSSVHLPPTPTPTPGLETEWLSWEGKHAIHLLFPPPSSSSLLLHTSSLPLQINKGSKREPSTQRDNSYPAPTLRPPPLQIFYTCVFPPGSEIRGDQDLVGPIQLHVSAGSVLSYDHIIIIIPVANHVSCLAN